LKWWPGGGSSKFSGITAGNRLLINAPPQSSTAGNSGREGTVSPKAGPLFEEDSEAMGHVHRDNIVPEGYLQLPENGNFSEAGPGVAWLDLNGDGREDVVVGAGAGSSTGILISNGTRLFAAQDRMVGATTPRDQTGLLGIAVTQDWNELWVALSPLDRLNRSGGDAFARIILRKGGAPRFTRTLSRPGMVPGALAAADVDGDGILDVFVSGRLVAGRFPEPAPSTLLKGRADGAYALEPGWDEPFQKLGMVSAAVFSDLDSNGTQDLITASQFGTVRIFLNDGKGRFTDATERYNFTHSGLWNGVATGDFNGDGRPDLIVTNRGEGGPEGRWTREGRRLLLYAGDLNGDGGMDGIVAGEEGGRAMPFAAPGALWLGLPWLRDREPDLAAAARRTLQDDWTSDTMFRWDPTSITTLSTKLFINRGDRFEDCPLPDAARHGHFYGVAVADFDGDGHEDLFFAGEEGEGAGAVPLLLRGDGPGRFAVVPPEEAGFQSSARFRGCAVGDANGDGRPDVVAGVNNGPTLLFKNRTGQPGLSIHLLGRKGNAHAVGARVRLLLTQGAPGAVREVQAGAGYLSDPSDTLILSPGDRQPRAIEVRWPGGTVTETPIEDIEKRFYRISAP
jgi:hypothetical protein